MHQPSDGEQPQKFEHATEKSKARTRANKLKKSQQQLHQEQIQQKPKYDQLQQPQSQRKKNQKKKTEEYEERWYGRFSCKICGSNWDSSHVYTVAGTKDVKYRQKCKLCSGEDAWVTPRELEPITCRTCGNHPCECLCNDCNRLTKKRYVFIQKVFKSKRKDADKENETPQVRTVRFLNKRFEYCDCKGKNTDSIGNSIDRNKPHVL